MKFLFIGDIVGRAGREAVMDRMPDIRDRLDLDFVVANGENAAGGFGITADIANGLMQAGVDVITGGNHSWDQRDIAETIDDEPRIMRPANFPEGTPGSGVGLFMARGGERVAIVNVMGRIFMDPLDDPFRVVDDMLSDHPLGTVADFILVDIHAEATSDKMAMGHFADGRASLVVGMDKEEPLRRFTTKISGGRFTPAQGEATICGVCVETDPATGLAAKVAPLRVGGKLKEIWPE